VRVRVRVRIKGGAQVPSHVTHLEAGVVRVAVQHAAPYRLVRVRVRGRGRGRGRANPNPNPTLHPNPKPGRLLPGDDLGRLRLLEPVAGRRVRPSVLLAHAKAAALGALDLRLGLGLGLGWGLGLGLGWG